MFTSEGGNKVKEDAENSQVSKLLISSRAYAKRSEDQSVTFVDASEEAYLGVLYPKGEKHKSHCPELVFKKPLVFC